MLFRSLEHQLGNFKDMCRLYKGGDQLYVPFRLQSAYAHASYVGATSYLDRDNGEQLSPTAVTDTYSYLIEAARCVIQAGHAFAKLLVDTHLADETANAETALGQQFALWDRL